MHAFIVSPHKVVGMDDGLLDYLYHKVSGDTLIAGRFYDDGGHAIANYSHNTVLVNGHNVSVARIPDKVVGQRNFVSVLVVSLKDELGGIAVLGRIDDSGRRRSPLRCGCW